MPTDTLATPSAGADVGKLSLLDIGPDRVNELHRTYSTAVMTYWSDSTLEHQDSDGAHKAGLRAIAETLAALSAQVERPDAGRGLPGVTSKALQTACGKVEAVASCCRCWPVDDFVGFVTIPHLTTAEVVAMADALAAHSASSPPASEDSFQARNTVWAHEVFAGDPTDLEERRSRFGEESLELQQALGQTADEAHQLVDYVHGRPIGEPAQEMGGVMTTLALLAWAAALDMTACGEAEFARCNKPESIAKIREKRSKRHGRGPLPGTYAPDFMPAPPAPSNPTED